VCSSDLLRSVLDASDEAGSTRNRRIKFMLTASGALVLMTQYDGPADAKHDEMIAAGVRELIVLPEKNLESVKPPYQSSPLDYVLVCIAAFAALILMRKFFGAARG
jgi:hypothetical protein